MFAGIVLTGRERAAVAATRKPLSRRHQKGDLASRTGPFHKLSAVDITRAAETKRLFLNHLHSFTQLPTTLPNMAEHEPVTTMASPSPQPDMARNRLPTLFEVLSRRTLPPVDLFSFYIYMRDQQRSVDYLDFW